MSRPYLCRYRFSFPSRDNPPPQPQPRGNFSLELQQSLPFSALGDLGEREENGGNFVPGRGRARGAIRRASGAYFPRPGLIGSRGMTLPNMAGGDKRKREWEPDEDEAMEEAPAEESCAGKKGRLGLSLKSLSLTKDLVSLAIVTAVNPNSLSLVLPGSVHGTAPLPKMPPSPSPLFWVGQVVTAKVMDLQPLDNGYWDVQLNISPTNLHSDLPSYAISAGMTLIGVVLARCDKGWQVGLGVGTVVAYLPDIEVTPGVQLVRGQLVYVSVEQVACRGGIVALSMNVDQAPMPMDAVGYDTLLPGMLVQTTVLEVDQERKCVKFDLGQSIEAVGFDDVEQMWVGLKRDMKVLHVHQALNTITLTPKLDLVPLRTTVPTL